MARARWTKGTPALFARANGSDGESTASAARSRPASSNHGSGVPRGRRETLHPSRAAQRAEHRFDPAAEPSFFTPHDPRRNDFRPARADDDRSRGRSRSRFQRQEAQFVRRFPSDLAEIEPSFRHFERCARANVGSERAARTGPVAIRTDSGVRAGNSVSLLIAELDIGARSAQLGASLAWWVRRCATCSAGLRCNVEASIQHVRLRDPLRGEGVFVEQPAEPVATAETIEQRRCEAPHTRSRIGGGSRIGGAFASGGCWPGERCFAPLMLRVDANHALEVTAAEDQQPVKALARRRIETQRSACAALAVPAPAPG